MSERPRIDTAEALKVLRSSSLAKVVQAEIETIILSGTYTAGEKLNESAIADQLGVSRGPVREAFQALHARGLVEMIPNRGVFVQRITKHDAVAIYDVRAGIFGTACRLLAERVTTTQIADLNALLAQMDVAGARRDLEAYFPLNIAFHSAIVNGTGNTVLSETYFGLVSRLHLFRARGLVHGGGFENSNIEHRAIVAALDARDPRAAFEAGFAHVQAGKQRIVTSGESVADVA
ncbi:FCD domain-containing protein [Tabrizicola piscis]|jgi:DNA-binding GntR family transcriptional regulator|uniref:FCD domain-containing protein n=1 Tax=Tabrizicola piscis TaxID=2494374 RepID=A0A3S8U4P0_9RHOB|nr:FCD domain-containing protein [Tabrizicola piscis]AZL58561.1 FCD domain-containing protein [Tabrizicola piscis]